MHYVCYCTLSLIKRLSPLYYLAFLVIGMVPTVNADIYKWYDEDGTVNYSQQPPVGVKTEQIKHADKAATNQRDPFSSTQSIGNYLKKYSTPSELDPNPRLSRSSNKPSSSEKSEKDSDSGSSKAKKSRKQKKLRNLAEQKKAYKERNLSGNKRQGEEPTNRVKTPSKLSKKLADRNK